MHHFMTKAKECALILLYYIKKKNPKHKPVALSVYVRSNNPLCYDLLQHDT